MDGESVLAHRDPRFESALDHPPAENALEAAKQEECQHARPIAARNRARPGKPRERHRKSDAKQPPEKAMRPFPPIDRLEVRKSHPTVLADELRDALILGELDCPSGIGERRHDSG